MRNLVGLGAYTTQYAAIFSTMNTKNCLSSVYRIPAISFDVKMVLTNAAPLGPYRGAGRPEAIYLIERLIDGAARAHGDRPRLAAAAQLHPAEGDALQDAERADLRQRRVRSLDGQGARARRLERASTSAAAKRAGRGKLRGIGMCCFLEVAGGILNEKADLRFEADGSVAIRLGVQAMGQGHLSTLPGILAQRLGVPITAIKADRGRQR